MQFPYYNWLNDYNWLNGDLLIHKFHEKLPSRNSLGASAVKGTPIPGKSF